MLGEKLNWNVDIYYLKINKKWRKEEGNMNEKEVAVLGGGAGGHAVAADLTLKGFKVNLFELPQFVSGIKPTMETGEIELTGCAAGIAKINMVTTDIEKAIKGVRTIFVVAQSRADVLFAEACTPYVEDGQIIVLCAGNCGSLTFANTFKNKKVRKDVVLAESASLPYGCRLRDPLRPGGPPHVRMLFFAPRFNVGVFPAKRTKETVKYLIKFYPGPVPETIGRTNVLEAGMSNPNPLVHCAPTLLNIGRIESVKDFALFNDGSSDSVIKVVIAEGKERERIFDVMGWKPLVRIADTPEEYMRTRFPGCVPREGVEEACRLKGPMGPISEDRYVTEDVPYGLVTYSSLGKMIGLETPTIDAVIQLFSVMNQVDYMSEGRTVEKLGISGLNIRELNNFLYEGF